MIYIFTHPRFYCLFDLRIGDDVSVEDPLVCFESSPFSGYRCRGYSYDYLSGIRNEVLPLQEYEGVRHTDYMSLSVVYEQAEFLRFLPDLIDRLPDIFLVPVDKYHIVHVSVIHGETPDVRYVVVYRCRIEYADAL